jgi:hypothetical protein
MRRTVGRAIVALLSAALLSTPGAAVAAPDAVGAGASGATTLRDVSAVLSAQEIGTLGDEEQPPFNSEAPSISGTAVAGQILTAVPGVWAEGTTFAYRWLAGEVEIAGAVGPTLVLSDTQIGASVSVEVTGSHAGYEPTTVRSPAVLIAARPLVSAKPTISGTFASGYTVTAKPGAWTAGTTFSYQWYRGTSAIAGATASTLTLDSTSVGRSIRVKVTGARTGHDTATQFSDSSPLVVAPGTPSVSGRRSSATP